MSEERNTRKTRIGKVVSDKMEKTIVVCTVFIGSQEREMEKASVEGAAPPAGGFPYRIYVESLFNPVAGIDNYVKCDTWLTGSLDPVAYVTAVTVVTVC